VTISSVSAALLCGWGVWSLAHNLGHRWWHVEMRQGKNTAYAHGEREHHRVYDPPSKRDWQRVEDPKALFISFPLLAVAPIGLLFVAGYGWLGGWANCIPFAVSMYVCMIADHQLHILFHKSTKLPGLLGTLQQMHIIHHATHRYNFFFVSGWMWDVLFGSARTRTPHTAQAP